MGCKDCEKSKSLITDPMFWVCMIVIVVPWILGIAKLLGFINYSILCCLVILLGTSTFILINKSPL